MQILILNCKKCKPKIILNVFGSESNDCFVNKIKSNNDNNNTGYIF